MKFRGKFTVIILAFAFIVASAYIANAQQASPSEPAVAPGNGAVRVDRDFGSFHKDDQNQFGDDRAYNSSEGHANRESDYQSHHWTPNTYGLMGNYGYDSNN